VSVNQSQHGKAPEHSERLHNLHTASLRLLSLLTVRGDETGLLQNAIESLAALIGARYAAIGLLDDDGKLKQFVHTGISPDVAARVGQLPEGKGLLGVVIHENHALRIDDMTRDPRSVGFPPHHPPMKSLLAVPVSYTGQVYGRVYLSEKADSTPFTDEDEQLVTRFADALALALHFHRAETERLAMQNVLQNVAHAVSAVTGQEFFQTLVTDLAKALNVDYVFVGEVIGERRDAVRTVVVNAKGLLADNFTYSLDGTPCLDVVSKTPCQYPRDVQQRFPEDRLLKEMGIESYVGYPLLGSGNQALGLLVVMDGKPMHDPLSFQAVLQICAVRAAAELERRQNEGERLRLASAVEQTADSVLITDAEGVIQYVNAAYEQVTGYTRAEAVGKKPNLVKSGHHDAAFYERLWTTIRRGEPFRDILVNRRKDGSLYYEEKTITPLKNSRGEITHYVSTGKDITERKHAEEALARTASEWTYSMDFIEDALYLIDLDDRVVRANRAFYRLTGLTPEQTLGHDITALMHPQGEPVPCPVCMARRERRDAMIVMEANHPDNPTGRPIEITVHIVRDQEGKPVSVLMGIHDLTRTRQMESELRHSQASLLEAQRMARLGNWGWDLTSGALTWSGELFRIFGLDPQASAPTAEEFLQAVHPDDRARVSATARLAIESGEPFSLDFRIVLPDGAVHIVHEEAEVVRDKVGKPMRMLGTTQDITERMRSEQEARRTQQFLDSVVENLPNMLFVKDAKDLRFVRFNRAAEELLGYSRTEMLGKGDHDFFPKDEADFFNIMDREVLNTGELMDIPEEHVRTRHRGTRLLHTRKIPILDERGQPLYLLGLSEDITERKQAESMLARLGRILDSSSNEIYVFCAESLRFIQANQGAQHNLGYSLEELKNLTPLDIKPDFSHESFEALLAPLRRGEQEVLAFVTSHRRKDGSLYPVEVRLQLARTESPPVFVAIVQDITERRQAEERLSFLAYHDTLTGLPNRALLLERLQQAMVDAERVNRLVAVMFLDLDRFKVINDTLGHHLGDALLKSVAERLQACVRPGDVIARLGGDEFTVILANVAHVDDVARVARKILDNFVQPFRVNSRDLFTTTSIGITIFPFDVHDAEGLLKNADAAMYHAKESGRNIFKFFTSELNVRAERRLKLETALRQALAKQELSVHYQPQVDLKSGRIVGMEALARWQHPELGQVPPIEFIPVAEETGLILPIGAWVLREACRQIKAWHETGFAKLQVAVNISGKQLLQKDFPQQVQTILRETGLAARYLDLELTESILMVDTGGTAAAMQALHALGVSFSVDDFGTGYSSLAYLKRFPIDILKIDRSFVRDLATDPNDVAIVKTIIAMAHTLEMRVIAEGVETYEQLSFLRAQGCDGSQGYYCSKPLTADDFTELLADWKRVSTRQVPPR
jgi:diguanylate cyclase (GGDEF)-like protein/PAS domain S-box-containing protein